MSSELSTRTVVTRAIALKKDRLLHGPRLPLRRHPAGDVERPHRIG